MDSLSRVTETANARAEADASFREAVRAAVADGASYRQIAKASMGLLSHEGARKIAKVRPIKRVRS
jgi:hypothetical protein